MANAAVAGRKRYVVGRTLGRGGMATVYLARDETLGRPVALKVLADNLAGDEVFRARFLREARLAARVVHPNVVQVYDAGADESSLYIAMEYVDGESLAEELRASRAACRQTTSWRSGSSSPPRSTPATRPVSSTATSSRRT